VRRAFTEAAAAFTEAARRYSVLYQPTGDGRATARAAGQLPNY